MIFCLLGIFPPIGCQANAKTETYFLLSMYKYTVNQFLKVKSLQFEINLARLPFTRASRDHIIAIALKKTDQCVVRQDLAPIR